MKRPMDKRTSERMGNLAARALKTGQATTAEVKRLAACALSQVSTRKSELAAKAAKKRKR